MKDYAEFIEVHGRSIYHMGRKMSGGQWEDC